MYCNERWNGPCWLFCRSSGFQRNFTCQIIHWKFLKERYLTFWNWHGAIKTKNKLDVVYRGSQFLFILHDVQWFGISFCCFILKIYLFPLWVFVYALVYRCAPVECNAHRGGKRVSDPLELQLQVTIDHLTWVNWTQVLWESGKCS